MPKATLEYNLDEVDDRDAHLRAIKSLSLTLALWEMDQHLRSELKYGTREGELSDEAYKAIERTREKLHEILEENGIILDELMR
jgi:hypothetical protein